MTQADTKKSDGLGNSRNRNWAFTTNNYTKEDIEVLLTQFTLAKLYIFQEETGENGTRHLQGTVGYANARSFKSMRKLHPGTHWEKCINLAASCRYCNKEDTRTGEQWKLDVDKYLIIPDVKGRHNVPNTKHFIEARSKMFARLKSVFLDYSSLY